MCDERRYKMIKRQGSENHPRWTQPRVYFCAYIGAVIAVNTSVAGEDQNLFLRPTHKTQDEISRVVKETESSQTWRVAVGVEYRFGIKSDMRVDAHRYDQAHPPFTPPPNHLPSQNAVLQQIGNSTIADGNRTYDDGHVNHDASVDGPLQVSQNWAATGNGQYDSADDTLNFHSLYGVETLNIGSHAPEGLNEENGQLGARLDFIRDLIKDDRFILKGVFGSSFMPRMDVFSARQNFVAGSYQYDTHQITDAYDVSSWGGVPPNPLQGSSSSFLPFVPSRTDITLNTVNENFSGGAYADVDLWMTEARLALQPEYNVCNRCSLFGQVGLALSYLSVRSKSGSWMDQNGVTDLRAHSDRDGHLIAQALLSVGVRFDITERVGLSVIGETRLPEVHVDVDADPYTGDVVLGVATTAVTLDYSF